MPVLNLSPTTELEAINLMLSVIGESPVNSAEDTGVVDAVVARQILTQSSRDVQLVGWHWNTEINFPIAASFPEGELLLPPNTLKVGTTGADASLDLVQRGNRLYDRANHTFNVGRTVLVEIVLLLPFDQLPEAARSYTVMRAARQFQERMVGSEVIWQFNSRDELRSWSNLQSAEAETISLNVFNDNPSVNRVLNRNPPGGIL